MVQRRMIHSFEEWDSIGVKILTELQRAEKKFPSWPGDPVHGAAVVAEEAGELIQATLKATYEDGHESHMHDEAVQVAAMAVRFLVWLGRQG